MTVIEAVPKYTSGAEVTDYNSAFNTESKSVQNGQITLTLKDVPLFVGDSISGSITQLQASTSLPAQGGITPATRGKCGDGICDDKEKANVRLCPQDCS